MGKLGILAVALALLVGGAPGFAGADPEGNATRMTVELVDGSQLAGSTSLRALPLHTLLGETAVPMDAIRSFHHDRAAESVRVVLGNGDVLTGVPAFDTFDLTTLLGPVKIQLNVVRGVRVTHMQDGLVLHYTFDEAGPSVTDLSGTGNHGTVHGATWTEAGKVGGAYAFDGEDDYIDGGARPSLDLACMTILAWVYVDVDAPENTCAWVARGQIRGSGLDYGVQLYKAHSLWFYAGDSKRYAGTGCGKRIGRWVHIAATYDGEGTANVFVNGRRLPSLFHSAMKLGTVPRRGYSLKIGRWAGQTLKGKMDEVMIYDRVLSDSEIARIHGIQR
jgi:hypothetical protein